MLVALALHLWVLVVLPSCTKVVRPPPAPLRSTLDVAALVAPDPPPTGPANVVFAAPTGRAAQDAEISIVFDGPVRPLGLDSHEPAVAATVEPPVPGRWEWVGTSALRYAAIEPLPLATRFVVTIPADAPALPGRAMAEAHQFTFETPRPQLVGSDPDTDKRDVPLDTTIGLHFDQPVDPGQAAQSITIQPQGSGTAFPFTAFRRDDDGPNALRLRPHQVLPAERRVVVRIADTLRGTAGPLPSGKAAEVSFKTAGPLRIVDARCTPVAQGAPECLVTGPIRLRLTRWVKTNQLEQVVSFVPAVEVQLDQEYDAERQLASYVLHGDFEPAKTYLLRVKRTLRGAPVVDDEGRPLIAGHSQRFVFGDRAPAVRFGGRGVYWPVGRAKSIPVSATNVTGIELSGAQLDPVAVMARLVSKDDQLVPPTVSFGIAQGLPDPKRNEPMWKTLEVAKVLGPKARGPVLLRGRATVPATAHRPAETTDRVQEVQLTNLGLFATVSATAVQLWVTELSSGQPVGNATVALRHTDAPKRILTRGKTNGDGLVRLRLPKTDPAEERTRTDTPRFVAFVRHGDDWAYQALNPISQPRAQGVAFTERGLYRPGETVHLKGIVRRAEGGRLVTPKDERFPVVVRSRRGVELLRFEPRLSRFGTWSRSFRLGDAVSLGSYEVKVGERGRVARTWFNVADYEPVDFSVETFTDRNHYIRGDVIRCRSEGRFLHGGPMARGKLRVALTRSESTHRPEALKYYHVGDKTLPHPPRGAGQTQGAFDDRGTHRYSTQLALPGMRSAEQVSCETYAADLDARVLTGRDDALVHPGEIYLGLKDLTREPEPGKELATEIRTVDVAGRHAGRPVTVELIRRVDDPAQSGTTDEILERCEVNTAAGDQTCTFAIPEDTYHHARRFLIVRGRTTDPRGNPIGASYEVVPEKRKPEPKLEPVAPTKPYVPRPYLRVLVPRGVQKVGQTLTASLRSPWTAPATALVMVARDVVMWRQLVALPSLGTTVNIPITEPMVPGVEVLAVAVKGEDSQQDTNGFEVDAKHHELDVDIQPSTTEARPGQDIEVAVRVLDHQGRPARAEVTLYGADEATLWLARYRLPEVFEQFFSERWTSVRTENARDHLFYPIRRLHRARPPRVRMGATHVGDERIRSDFRQTVLFEPNLVTDAQGWVRKRVTLPDGLTTYRFMAVAVTEGDRFGSSKTEVISSKPLMVRAKLPAVVRTGDRFKVAALVTLQPATETKAGAAPRAKLGPTTVLVGLRIKGLELHGADQRRITLEPNVARRIEFDVSAKTAGPFQVTLGASTTGTGHKPFADIIRRVGEVKTPTYIETASLHGDTTRPVAESLGDLRTIRPDTGELTVTLAKTRLVGLDQNIHQLLEYPYGCTEQTASRMLPLLSLRELATEVQAKLPPNTEAKLAEAVRRLHSHQQPDGGFGAWPGSSTSDVWITAHALWALDQARRGGVVVPPELIDEPTRYLETYLAGTTKALGDGGSTEAGAHESSSLSTAPRLPIEMQLTTAAFVVDVLAGVGKALPQEIDWLLATRDQLPPFAKALLLHAMVAGHYIDLPVRKALAGELASSVRLAGNAAYALRPADGLAPWQRAVLASDTRSTALLLRALVAAAPNHPLVPKLVTGLLTQLGHRRGATTQDNAWALTALDAYRRAHPSASHTFTARAFLNDDLLNETRFEPGGPLQTTVKVPVNKLGRARAGKLTFDVRGKGRLHYQARLRFARRKLPTRPHTAGMTIHRAMRRVAQYAGRETPLGSPSERFSAGDLVRVDVQVVTTAPRHFVVVDDPLPGGLVAIDPALRTGLLETGGGSRGYDHRELRDDRVLFFVDHLPAGIRTFSYWARARTPGSYVQPPTVVQEMYAPEIRGATGVTRVDVHLR
ncbi:MAG: Ig-like domain-containing protein [Deltaproteobacteria bacterium]|nr:Ig-like domain-containing protein [Deltaproteobacteria bacterium]